MTRLVGILNLTPDSFSDGDPYATGGDHWEKLLKLRAEGAAIIDLGAESTRPGATQLTPEVEWNRLEPILTRWRNEAPEGTVLSVDSRHPETMRRALDYGIGWINDVGGMKDPAMIEVAQGCDLPVVIMHSLTVPADKTITLPRDADPVDTILRWAEERRNTLVRAGIAERRLIIDPGIGFGKTPEQSWELLTGFDALKQEGHVLLVGHSRKSFFSLFRDASAIERDADTAILTVLLARHGVDYLRVHNVALNALALTFLRGFRR